MKTSTKTDTLSPEARRLHDKLVAEWRIVDSAGLTTLMVACQALDRLRQAQDIIRTEGLLVKDRFGQTKAHPASVIEREARAGLLMSLKALNLDLASLEEGSDATGA